MIDKKIIFKFISIVVTARTGMAVTEKTRLGENCKFNAMDYVELFLKMDTEFSFDLPDEVADEIVHDDCMVSEIIEKVASAIKARPENKSDWKKEAIEEVERLQIKAQNVKRSRLS